MKKLQTLFIVAIATLLASNIMFAQDNQTDTTKPQQPDDKVALNIGVLMGGGGLVGADLEVLVYKGLGLQVGAGLGSFGFGINYHFNQKINSQFFSIQYFQQGFGENHFGTYIGPMYVYRYKKLFQAGIGIGSVTKQGPAWSLDEKQTLMMLYNIGVYFPF